MVVRPVKDESYDESAQDVKSDNTPDHRHYGGVHQKLALSRANVLPPHCLQVQDDSHSPIDWNDREQHRFHVRCLGTLRNLRAKMV